MNATLSIAPPAESLRVGTLAVRCRLPAVPTRPPVLFIHGILAAGWMFEPWLESFAARGHPAYAMDLRGHGDSPAPVPLGKVRLADYLDDAIACATMLTRRGAAPVVVGHSMGGLLAQKLGERGLATAVVLLGSAPPRGINLLTARLLRTMIPYAGALLFSRSLVPRAADLDRLSLNAVTPANRVMLLRRFGAESGRAARELAFGGMRVDASAVRCPVLVLSGDDDRFVALATSRRIAARYEAPCVVLSGHGHLPMWEPGEPAVRERILGWLAASVVGSGGAAGTAAG